MGKIIQWFLNGIDLFSEKWKYNYRFFIHSMHCVKITLYNISEKNIHNTYDVTLSSSLSDNIVRRKEFKNLHLHNS